ELVALEPQCFAIAIKNTDIPLRPRRASSHTPRQRFAARCVRGPAIRRPRRCNKEDEMRKFLLASVATLGTGGLTGAALAQPAAARVGAPTKGQVAYPAAPAPVAYVNENNNYQAPALPGPLANPTPGTIVVHFNGKVQVDFAGVWTSADTRFV